MVLVVRKPVIGLHTELFFNHGEKFWIFFGEIMSLAGPEIEILQVEGQNGLHSVGLDLPRQVGGTGLGLGGQEAGD